MPNKRGFILKRMQAPGKKGIKWGKNCGQRNAKKIPNLGNKGKEDKTREKENNRRQGYDEENKLQWELRFFYLIISSFVYC